MYRVEIGAVAVGVLLFVLTTLRLASFGRTFTAFGAGPVKTEAEDPAQAIDAAGIEVERLGNDVRRAAAGLQALAQRVDALEARLEPGEPPPA